MSRASTPPEFQAIEHVAGEVDKLAEMFAQLAMRLGSIDSKLNLVNEKLDETNKNFIVLKTQQEVTIEDQQSIGRRLEAVTDGIRQVDHKIDLMGEQVERIKQATVNATNLARTANERVSHIRKLKASNEE